MMEKAKLLNPYLLKALNIFELEKFASKAFLV
jgi:hypothetical protein